MNKDEKELWENVQYRMDVEGFHYCFDGYSSWEDIQDEAVVNNKEFIYYGKSNEKPTEKEFQERQRRKERTRLLKLKSVK